MKYTLAFHAEGKNGEPNIHQGLCDLYLKHNEGVSFPTYFAASILHLHLCTTNALAILG